MFLSWFHPGQSAFKFRILTPAYTVKLLVLSKLCWLTVDIIKFAVCIDILIFIVESIYYLPNYPNHRNKIKCSTLENDQKTFFLFFYISLFQKTMELNLLQSGYRIREPLVNHKWSACDRSFSSISCFSQKIM